MPYSALQLWELTAVEAAGCRHFRLGMARYFPSPGHTEAQGHGPGHLQISSSAEGQALEQRCYIGTGEADTPEKGTELSTEEADTPEN